MSTSSVESRGRTYRCRAITLYWNRNNLQEPCKAKYLSFISCFDLGHWILKLILRSCWDLQCDAQSSVLPLLPAHFTPRVFPVYFLLFGFPLLFPPFSPLSCYLSYSPRMHLSLPYFSSKLLYSFHLMTLVSSCWSVHYVSLLYCYSRSAEM